MRIIIVDDDKLVVSSLKTIVSSDPDIKVVACGYDGKEAVSLFALHQPDILLMDIRMDKMTGLEAGSQILKQYPDAKILYLTTFLDDEYIIKAIYMGAKGYLLKQNFDCIIPSLKAVASHQSIFGSEIASKIPTLMNQNQDFSNFDLNKKEIALMQLVAQGLNNKEISQQLYLSEGTIRNYLSDLLDKLELRDRTQLAVFYYQHK